MRSKLKILANFSYRDASGDASEVAILKSMQLVEGDVTEYRNKHRNICGIPFNSTNKFQVRFNNHILGTYKKKTIITNNNDNNNNN